ncbi:MAG: glucokinase [Desulfobulbaceae bacterium]
MEQQNRLLAGDIGGTKTVLALYGPDDPLFSPSRIATFANDRFRGPEELIAAFLDDVDERPARACFGVAGPVRADRVAMTNLEWTVDGPALAARFGLGSVTLVNDLVATAVGAVHLPADRLWTIQEGTPDPLGPVAVIAPGTGLGESFLVRRADSLIPVPSEGGHSSFAPTDEEQHRLLAYMAARHDHVSVERVCSGPALPALREFVCAERGLPLPPRGADDPVPRLIEEGMNALRDNRRDNPSLLALELFVSILAAEAANLALKVLATGGLYIGGGILPRIRPLLTRETFSPRFARGAYREMLAAIPVHGILEEKTALFGAAALGRAPSSPGTTP